MSDPTNLPRLYGEQEIGRILKRATELQHQEPTAPTAAGVSLQELEEIASEAGIDPRYLRRAALEVDSGLHDSSIWTRVVGDEIVLVRELTLPGELSEDGFERIVSVIQTHSKEHGQPSLLGQTLTWRAETASKTRTIQIVVTSRDGHTQIRLEENLTQLAVGLFAGTTSGFGVGLGVGVGVPMGTALLGSGLFAIAAPIGALGISYIAARAIYRSIVQGRSRRIATLFGAVVEETRASIERALGEEPGQDALPAPGASRP
mgnify:CR=1 FL=1